MAAAETAKSLAPMTVLDRRPIVSRCRQTADVVDLCSKYLVDRHVLIRAGKNLGFLDFFKGFLGFNAHNAEHRYHSIAR